MVSTRQCTTGVSVVINYLGIYSVKVISHLKGTNEVRVGINYLGIYSVKVISHLEGTKEERAIWRQPTVFGDRLVSNRPIFQHCCYQEK